MMSKICSAALALVLSSSLAFGHDHDKNSDKNRFGGNDKACVGDKGYDLSKKCCGDKCCANNALMVLTKAKEKIEYRIRHQVVTVMNIEKDVRCREAALLYSYNLAYDHFEGLKAAMLRCLPASHSRDEFVSMMSEKFDSDDADKVIFVKAENTEGDIVVVLSDKIVNGLGDVWESYQKDNDAIVVALSTQDDLRYNLANFFNLTGYVPSNITARPDFNRGD